MWKKIEKKVKAEGHRVEKNVIRPIAHDIRAHVLSSTPQPQQQNPNNFFSPEPASIPELSPAQELQEHSHAKDNKNPFECPLTLEIMKDPVTAADGNTYEREALQTWYNSGHRTCPLNPAAVLVDPKELNTNIIIRDLIEERYPSCTIYP